MTPVENCENLYREDVVIPAGGSEAPPILTEGRAIVAIEMPGTWTAAKVGFEVSVDGATFCTAYDNAGGLLEASAAASRHIAFPLDSALYGPFLKVKSTAPAGTGVAEVQAADRTLKLLFRRLFGGR
jgi:hypothetical protein